MRLLGDAVFVRSPGRDPAGAHPVVLEHRAKPRRQLAPATVFQLVGRRREIVAAQHRRHAAERPDRALQPGHQRLERLAERDGHPAPPAVAQNELEEQMRERPPAIVTPSSVPWVKSIAASRPGTATCSKYTSGSGPCSARHSRNRRCSVRAWPS